VGFETLSPDNVTGAIIVQERLAPRYRRAARSIGKIGGQFPILISPMTSNPCRSYKGMFLGFVDSR
jgi:hypothetical protein